MSTKEQQSVVDFKELREGMSLGGVYTLEQWIRQDGAGTFFAAVTDDGERLLLKLAPAHGPEAEQQFATWQRCRYLRHRHLLDVRDVGRCEVAGNRYIYGVFEYPDDVLASALGQGPLSEPETRGVLEAALAALRYLHGEGLVHGAIAPDRVVAVGETVKLATDGLRESDSKEGQAEDVRQLGELVRTLRAPEPLSEPMATIVEHATAGDARRRWTLADIARAIEPPLVSTAAAAMPDPAPSPRRSEADASPARTFPKWIFAGVAILLLSILLYNLRRQRDDSQVSMPPAPVMRQGAAVVQPRAPSPRPTAPPASATWRVIAFTYHSRDLAVKKANQINQRWPELRAAVFMPKGVRGYYLVALGERMDREEATRLQHKARRLGLPRDIYVQNYSE